MPAARAAVLTVGLSGGVASGKSTVAALLAIHGAAVLDADALVATLYEPGQPCTGVIAGRFGPGVLRTDGGVDRKALGALVLADSEARGWLESVVHPAVKTAITSWLEAHRSAVPAPLVAVVEAALLVETGSFRNYHRLVIVTAPINRRRERAGVAGWDDARFARTVAAQARDEQREAVADYVVSNRSDQAALATAVSALWDCLQHDAALVSARRPLPAHRPAIRLP